MTPVRVAFLFNHYLTYQVHHGAPFAFELSRRQPAFQVDLLFSTAETRREAEKIAALYPGHRCRFQLLTRPRSLAFFSPSLHRPLVLLANRKTLAAYDALIAPEKNYLVLKALPAFHGTRFIGLRHGAGDRPVSFHKGPLKFDGLLVPGQSYYDRYSPELPDGCCEIVGYPKFEILEKLKPGTHRFFNDDRPVVLYSPHFHPKQSSWKKIGRDVLAWFARNNKYNLIFAPHTRLFKHRKYRGNIDTDEFSGSGNIIIDRGSERSCDMSYTRAADIYLGDVSSLVYEFLYDPKPCIFLNPAQAKWENNPNFRFWHLGEVLTSTEPLGQTLDNARANHQSYREKQREAVKEAFDLNETPSSVRAADAIAGFLSVRSPEVS